MTIVLCFKKIIGPENDWHKIIGSNEFSLSRALGVDLLFGGRINGHAFTKRHAATRMTMHIRMHCMRAVNPPFGNGDRVSTQDQRKLNGSAQIMRRLFMLKLILNFQRSSMRTPSKKMFFTENQTLRLYILIPLLHFYHGSIG